MDFANITKMTNDSGVLQSLLNDSFDSAKDNLPKTASDHVITFLVCMLGLPGNLLIMAVYVRKMTTSTRVYMFALAVADTAVCVCGIALTTTPSDLVTIQAFIYAFDMSTSFSMFLLVYVSIERLTAVRRPHSFNIKVQRAKTALKIIAGTAVFVTTVTTIATLKDYKQFNQVFEISTLCLCVATMTTCYCLTAAALINKTRSSMNRVAVLNRASEPGSSQIAPQRVGGTSCTHLKLNDVRPDAGGLTLVGVGPSNLSTKIAEMTPVQSNFTAPSAYTISAPSTAIRNTVATQTKNITLLFIVTVVFIACWLPKWMSTMGIPIPKEVRRSFIINSVVNPFIYGVASAMFREDVRQFYRQIRVKCFHWFQ